MDKQKTKQQLEEIISAAINGCKEEHETHGEGGQVSQSGQVEKIVQALLDRNVIIPPCKPGDFVYWVDALNHVSPVKVADFALTVVDVKGSTYMGDFQNGGLHVTEEGAAKQVMLNRKNKCKQCYVESITGNYPIRCENGKECSYQSFKEENAERWKEEAIAQMIAEDEKTCKGCYISHRRRGRDLDPDCAYCSGKAIKDRCAVEWEKELEKTEEKENNEKI